MSDEEHTFVYCEPGTEKPWLPAAISFPLGILVTIILILTGKLLQKKKIPTTLDKPSQFVLQVFTILMTIAGTLTYLYESSLNFGSLISCSPILPKDLSSHTVSRWITFFVHLYFFCRAFLTWLCHWDVQISLTIIDIALFTQDIVALGLHQQMLAFHYLVVINFYSRGVRAALLIFVERFFPRRNAVFKIAFHLTIVTFLLAGTLRVVEEWKTNRGLHPTLGGSLAPMRSAWSYIYMMVITLSSVGYGDMTPSTDAGRVLVIIIIVVFLTWFSVSATHLTELLHDARVIFIEKDSFENSENKSRYLVIGCASGYQLQSFLEHFPKFNEKLIIVFVYENYYDDSIIHNRFGIQTYKSDDPLEAVRALNMTVEDSIFFHLNQEDPVKLDKSTLHLVKRIKDNGCQARLFVSVTTDRSLELLHCIKGWRLDGTDVSIATQGLDAHMLVLSAHSRVIPALVSSALIKGLEIAYDESASEVLSFGSAATTEYFLNSRILLGAISTEHGTLFFPDTLEPEWFRIALVTSKDKNGNKKRRPEIQPQISTSTIASDISVVGTASDCLKDAIDNHPFPLIPEDLPEVKLYECQLVSRPRNTYGFLKARKDDPDGQFVSTLEHRYEACRIKNTCLCGTFENAHLSTSLLAIADQHPFLYDFWMYIIEGDHLGVEEIELDCLYGDLFRTMVTKWFKIPIGVEVTEEDGEKSYRLPLLNPSTNFQVKKGDLVAFVRS